MIDGVLVVVVVVGERWLCPYRIIERVGRDSRVKMK